MSRLIEVYVNNGLRVHLARASGIFSMKTLCGRTLMYPVPNVGSYTLNCPTCIKRDPR